jgi:hypothetical protein
MISGLFSEGNKIELAGPRGIFKREKREVMGRGRGKNRIY